MTLMCPNCGRTVYAPDPEPPEDEEKVEKEDELGQVDTLNDILHSLESYGDEEAVNILYSALALYGEHRGRE